ncbi:hypothetical protein BV20DRAFT_244785 [Pilatotrama ljubarskyi]|nr:hypothetical protein BV20DRAFT_244785 [Pilatotrama ljubarskyi]
MGVTPVAADSLGTDASSFRAVRFKGYQCNLRLQLSRRTTLEAYIRLRYSRRTAVNIQPQIPGPWVTLPGHDSYDQAGVEPLTSLTSLTESQPIYIRQRNTYGCGSLAHYARMWTAERLCFAPAPGRCIESVRGPNAFSWTVQHKSPCLSVETPASGVRLR